MSDYVKRKQIFDPVNGQLIHEIISPLRVNYSPKILQRIDVAQPMEFLQTALIHIPPLHEFRPHVHLVRSRKFDSLRAQEAWVVLSGEVEVDYYTDSGQFVQSETLGQNDISISYRGGHGYRAFEKGAVVYEFKSGPYEGQEIDKKFI
jgi:hypothetical protein